MLIRLVLTKPLLDDATRLARAAVRPMSQLALEIWPHMICVALVECSLEPGRRALISAADLFGRIYDADYLFCCILSGAKRSRKNLCSRFLGSALLEKYRDVFDFAQHGHAASLDQQVGRVAEANSQIKPRLRNRRRLPPEDRSTMSMVNLSKQTSTRRLRLG